MVSGKRKEFTGYSPKVGFFQSSIVAINPSLEELNDFIDISNMKEPDYNKDFEDRNDDNKSYPQAVITIYLKAHDGTIFSKRFPIVNKVRYSKEGNIQYINNIGNTTWALPDEQEEEEGKKSKHISNSKYAWFTKREFRPALMGEEKLYNFLQKWTSLDWKDPDTTLTLDNAKLFKGNFKELQNILSMEEFKDASVVGYASIHTSIPSPTDENPEPEPKYYQNIWDEFLPGNAWRYLYIAPVPGTPVLDIPLYKMTLPSWIQDYVNNMTGEYGSKDYLGKTVDNKLQIELLRDFSTSESPIARASSIHSDASNSNATPNYNPAPETIDDLPF